MSFYVNRHSSDGHGTPSRTTVHRADCVWARRYGGGEKWQCFQTLERAIAYAKETPYPLNFCGVCDPRTAMSSASAKGTTDRPLSEPVATSGAGGKGRAGNAMLREFRVDNFKSLINVVFEPRGANLLIGRNNSGKTNLCQALRFVSASAVWKLDEAADMAAGMRFGMTCVALDKSTIDFIVRAELPRGGERLAFEYELTVSPPRPGSGETAVRLEREVLRVDGGAFDDAVLLENVAGQGRLLHEKDSGNGASAGADGATRVKARLEDFPLGEQHFRDMLR